MTRYVAEPARHVAVIRKTDAVAPRLWNGPAPGPAGREYRHRLLAKVDASY